MSVTGVIGLSLLEDLDDCGVEVMREMLSGADVVAPVDVERAFDLQAHDVFECVQVVPVVGAKPIAECGSEVSVKASLVLHGRAIEDDRSDVPGRRRFALHGGMLARRRATAAGLMRRCLLAGGYVDPMGRPIGTAGGTGAHAARPQGVPERAACGGA